MLNLSSIRVHRRATEVSASLNVQESNVSGEQILRLQFLACFLQASVDSLTLESGVRASYSNSRRMNLLSPWGPISVTMPGSRQGGWEHKFRRYFQEGMSSTGKDVYAAVESAISSRRIVPISHISGILSQFVGDKATSDRCEYVQSELRLFMEVQSLVESRDKTAKLKADALRNFVMDNGLPADVVQIGLNKPKVNLAAVFSAANLSIATVQKHGLHLSLQDEMDSLAAKQTWTVGLRSYIPTRNRPHGRETYPGLVVDFQQLHVARMGLLDDIIASLSVPADHFKTQSLLRWIEWLITPPIGKQRDAVSSAARLILSKKTTALQWEDGKALLDGLVNRLDSGDYKPRTRHEYLAAFHSCLETAFERAGKLFPRYQVSEKVFGSNSSRGLISDQPDPAASDESLRPAIINVAVGKPSEAKDRAQAHVEDRLERVRSACDTEIERFVAWRSFQSEAEATAPSADGVRFFGHVINFQASYSRKGYSEWLQDGELTDIVGTLLAASRERRIYEEQEHRAIRQRSKSLLIVPTLNRLYERFPSLADWGGEIGPAWWVALSRWYVPRWVKVAIELRVQIETGWNRDTVCNLRPNGVSFSGGMIELQSIKGKTGELQQKVIESPGKWLRVGLELMLEHQKCVVQYWPHETDKIFTAIIKKKDGWCFGRGVDFQLLERFITRHQLPPFTREQLRNQVAAGDYLKHDDPHRIQGLLGHGDLRATSNYLRQTVIAVLNRANIAEFRRQLGTTIVWAVEGEEKVIAHGMRIDDINKNLLFPVSDNNSPQVSLPACDAWVREPNKALVIDRVRLAHLVRQRAYYVEHWQRLRAEAPERFEKIHRPRIEFTAALWATVCDSPYADLLEEGL